MTPARLAHVQLYATHHGWPVLRTYRTHRALADERHPYTSTWNAILRSVRNLAK